MGAEYTRPMHKRINKIIGSFAVSTTSIATTLGGLNATINVLTGNVWINDKITAVADSTAFKMSSASASVLDINADTINMISDASGATVQLIIWDD